MLYGKDAGLLELRGKVLRTAGLVVDTAVDMAGLKDRIAEPGVIYDGIVCCHSVDEAEGEEVAATANRSRIALLKLEHLLTPPDLIAQVSNLVREGRSLHERAKRSSDEPGLS